MKTYRLNPLVLAGLMVVSLVCGGCSQFHQTGTATTAAPLPSWSDGPTKTAIIQFVHDVSTTGSQKYVRPEERIATFDNDGTLWSEQPAIQIAYVVYQVQKMAADHPEWKGKQPYKAAIDGDMDFLVNDLLNHGKAVGQLFKVTHTGINLAEFNVRVEEFFARAEHPKFGVPYTQVTYQPMLELLDFLRANGFKTYICSGGGIDFMRVISEEIYGIVPEQVIGSYGRNVFKEVDGKWQLMKTADQFFMNDKKGKPEGIDLHIGRIPIFATGNVRSSGDIAMLTFSQTNSLPSFQLLINHDDGQREFKYAEKDGASLSAAQAGGWHVVNMKEDWKQIFPF